MYFFYGQVLSSKNGYYIYTLTKHLALEACDTLIHYAWLPMQAPGESVQLVLWSEVGHLLDIIDNQLVDILKYINVFSDLLYRLEQYNKKR